MDSPPPLIKGKEMIKLRKHQEEVLKQATGKNFGLFWGCGSGKEQPLSSDIYDELIESGYYNHNNKRVQFKDEFNSIVYKISEYINEKYKDKEFSEYLLEQSLI